jgi:hypothetical protein
MIRFFARPLPSWTPPGDWTQLTVDGDDEEVVASVMIAHLLLTRHEVEVEEDTEPLQPVEDADETT